MTAQTLQVAIVGSGPSGFYAAEVLLDSGLDVAVTVYEKMPVPFGLVRFGVAPDHPKLKTTTTVFEHIAQRPGFSLIGNVTVGRDLSIQELRQFHHAVIFAYGAGTDNALEIPGESLPGSHTATEFVGWYNGHPDYRDRHFDLSQPVAAIIGQGNVAADVARILLSPIDVLARSDIATHALDALRESQVREVRIIGRRSAAQAKFSVQELRELGELADVDVAVADGDLQFNDVSREELADRNNFLAGKNVALFQDWAARPSTGASQRLVFHFLRSPQAVIGDAQVQGLMLDANTLQGAPFAQRAVPTGQVERLDCGLVFRSVGYRGLPLPGLPFDARKGVIPNQAGRVTDHPGLYATGWIKRGPSGIVGTNRACAAETVGALLEDAAVLRQSGGRAGSAAALDALKANGLKPTDYSGWTRIDAEEQRLGAAAGKPREKLVSVAAMLAVAGR